MSKFKFKDLTDELIERFKSEYDNRLENNLTVERLAINLGTEFNLSERTIRKWFKKLNFKEKVDIEPEQYVKAKTKVHDGTKKRFIITWAQNATPFHKGFWDNLKRYSEFIDAEILVIPGRYHNMTNPFLDSKSENEKQDWWDSNLLPYLTLNRHNLNKNLCILSDVSIQPTATNPLNSLESLTLGESGIIGHPRVHMKTLPVLDSTKPRFLFSTGTCTVKNFSQSKAGKIAEFHSTLGAVIVEIKNDDEFFIRQITGEEKSGDFCDLYYEVSKNGVNEIKESYALIKGDIHYGNHDKKILKSSFEKLIPKIKPSKIILHDVFDGSSINHHELNNFVTQYQNEKNGTNSLKKEIDNMLEWLETIKHHNLVIVFSNHDDFLTRFIINGDPKKNVKNALEYMEYGKILLEGNAPNGLIPYIINKKFKNIKCLGRNESYKIKDWELGIHGMDGINGSRGGIQQYRKLNSKVISAHAHSPMRLDGALQVGTNTSLRMGYNNGVSTWAHSDVILFKNNKAQHIFYNSEGEFTTFK